MHKFPTTIRIGNIWFSAQLPGLVMGEISFAVSVQENQWPSIWPNSFTTSCHVLNIVKLNLLHSHGSKKCMIILWRIISHKLYTLQCIQDVINHWLIILLTLQVSSNHEVATFETSNLRQIAKVDIWATRVKRRRSFVQLSVQGDVQSGHLLPPSPVDPRSSCRRWKVVVVSLPRTSCPNRIRIER